MDDADRKAIRAKFNKSYLLILCGALVFLAGAIIYFIPVSDRLPLAIVLPLGEAGLDVLPWLIGTAGAWLVAVGEAIRSEAHGDRLQAEYAFRQREGTLDDPEFVGRLEALQDAIIRDAVRAGFRYRMRVAWFCLVLVFLLIFAGSIWESLEDTAEPVLIAIGLGAFVCYRFVRTLADRPPKVDDVKRALGR